jgi:hypothetical protein
MNAHETCLGDNIFFGHGLPDRMRRPRPIDIFLAGLGGASGRVRVAALYRPSNDLAGESRMSSFHEI